VRPYWAILSARFRVLLQYRAAAAAGLATQVFWGFIRIMIFAAFYAAKPEGQPMTFGQVVTYIWLGQALLRMMPWGYDAEVRTMIRSGTLAYEMVRPVKLYWFWYTRSLAGLMAPTLLRAVPMLVLAGLFFGLEPPASWASLGAFLAAIGASLLLGAAIATLLTITMLWTISGEGIASLINAAVWLFSGIMIPLPLFPDWAQAMLKALPFRGIFDTPLQLYTGLIPAAQMPGLLLNQLAWAAGMVALGQFVLSRGTRRLVVQGG